jgi:SAM-dependent methyltransferase
MYDHLEAKLHDLFWASEGPSAELELIQDFLKEYPGTALELGCGSGRLLAPLLKDGFLMEGLDNSQDMLQLCKKNTQGFEPVLHQASIENFNTGSVYNAITIPAFTLQLVHPDKVSITLANIQQHLHPGGGLYLTIFIPWAEITGDLEEGTWFIDQEAPLTDNKKARCHTRFQIKRITQLLQREHRYEIVDEKNNVLEQSRSTQQLTWFWQREITLLLKQAGFSTKHIIGDFAAGISCDDNSQVLTIIACKEDPE